MRAAARASSRTPDSGRLRRDGPLPLLTTGSVGLYCRIGLVNEQFAVGMYWPLQLIQTGAPWRPSRDVPLMDLRE
jgi:hypothetical protein